MIKASFVYQIYISNDGSYSVNHFLVKEAENEIHCRKGDVITVIGNNVPTYKNVTFLLQGEWVPYKKGNGEMQLKMHSFNEIIPTSGEEILGYMESGIIKGIGSKNAKVIYNAFGKDSLSVIENTPEKLLDLKGFGKKSVEKITSSYKEHVNAKDTLLFLGKIGIDAKMGMKIFKRYGENTENEIRDNPYCLLSVKGLGFDFVDSIALRLGQHITSDKRIEAGIVYTLKLLEQEDGNIGSPITRLEERLYQVLNLPTNSQIQAIVNNIANKMIYDKKVIIRHNLCFRPEYYDMETECATHIIRIASKKPEIAGRNVLETIKKVQERENIVLDGMQEVAVISAVKENFLVITGGPGSGKTTTIRCIVEVLKELWPKKTFKLMAPTGRAARRMSESTNMYASTIHSGLKISTDEESDYEAMEVEEDFIIIDEVSMIDMRIATLLFRAIGTGKKVLFIGDDDQLPSVGPGAVLRDIIISNTVNVVKLEKIFRQDKDSRIYINSRKIKNESTDLLEGTDFSIIDANSFEDAAALMHDVYQEKIKEWGIDNVALLTPYRKHVAGCEYMNKEIQSHVNPNRGQGELLYRSKIFRVGDKVMNLINTEKDGVDIANGDIGVVTDIDVIEKSVTVEFFGDSSVVFEDEELEELELAYSYTVHKSQGGEYDCVITSLCDQHIDKMKTKNLLYTAITRGKKEVIIIGSRNAITYAIKHKLDNVRYTQLAEKMILQNKKQNVLH